MCTAIFSSRVVTKFDSFRSSIWRSGRVWVVVNEFTAVQGF
jgi:hypothetical protein